jgi:DNA-binding MarR family transcriptional regulator
MELMATTAMSDQTVDFGFLTDHVIHHYRLLNLELTRLHAKLFKDTPMQKGVGKMTAMTLLELNPGLTQATIARSINKDKAAIARIIDELVREGFINRDISPEERRSYSLTLTEQGHAEFARFTELSKACEAAFTEGLTQAERDQLLHLLRKLRKIHTPDMIGIA